MLVKPVNTHESVTVTHDPPGEPVTRYEVMADPPETPAVHETVTVASPATVCTDIGTPGVVAGVVVVFVVTGVLSPMVLVAVTRK